VAACVIASWRTAGSLPQFSTAMRLVLTFPEVGLAKAISGGQRKWGLNQEKLGSNRQKLGLNPSKLGV